VKKRLFAAVLIVLVLAVLAFSTWQLFQGNFAAAMSSMPLLLLFYLFLASRSRGG
jgi:hypothetical protein